MCNILTFEKKQEETIEDQQEWTEGLFWEPDKGGICNFCSITMDIPLLDILRFFHED
jgi:hypothetical protein